MCEQQNKPTKKKEVECCPECKKNAFKNGICSECGYCDITFAGPLPPEIQGFKDRLRSLVKNNKKPADASAEGTAKDDAVKEEILKNKLQEENKTLSENISRLQEDLKAKIEENSRLQNDNTTLQERLTQAESQAKQIAAEPVITPPPFTGTGGTRVRGVMTVKTRNEEICLPIYEGRNTYGSKASTGLHQCIN